MSNKQAIIDNFQILERYYKQEGDRWRTQAYSGAIRAIQQLNISDIKNINQVKKVPGLGKQSVEKINEYLETGQIAKAEEVKTLLVKEKEDRKNVSQQRILGKFSSVLGAGEKTAQKWWDAGMRSLDDLRKNPNLLTKEQKIGLKYYDDLHTRIPREYIDTFQLMVRYVLAKEVGMEGYELIIAGSYRRKNKTSGDIDILITSKKLTLKRIVDILKKWGIITDVISMQKEKFMGIAHCPSGQYFYFHVDIVFLPKEQWGAGLLWFTGSKGFNIQMRSKAKKMGYTLNQHGLFNKNGDQIPVYTEKEIMKALGMKWVPPEKR
jgi:DNA polymerase/3'-5' exonuclease PolX